MDRPIVIPLSEHMLLGKISTIQPLPRARKELLLWKVVWIGFCSPIVQMNNKGSREIYV